MFCSIISDMDDGVTSSTVKLVLRTAVSIILKIFQSPTSKRRFGVAKLEAFRRERVTYLTILTVFDLDSYKS